MIVAKIDNQSGHYVGVVWVHSASSHLKSARFSGGVYERESVRWMNFGRKETFVHCNHAHREQGAAEACTRGLILRLERERENRQ